MQKRLELEFEIDRARAAGDEKRLTQLEARRDIEDATLELIRAGLQLEDARVLATQRVNDLRKAELIGEENKAAREKKTATISGGTKDVPASDPTLLDNFGDDLRENTKTALKEAMRTGDYGTAFGQAIKGAADNAFSSAVDNFVDTLFDALSKTLGDALSSAFSGGASDGIGSFVASLFGGNKASGGAVYGGRAYMVGENGPEMFAPSTAGTVIPNSKLSDAMGPDTSKMGGALVFGAPTINIMGDASEATVNMIDQRLRDYSRSLPSAIDARIRDRTMRGAY